MLFFSSQKFFSLLFSVFLFVFSFGQLPYGIIDGREMNLCASCVQTIKEKPPEVLFGIDIHENGDVYFSMNNKEWFNKIFKNDAYGVTADIVSKDQYDCSKPFIGSAKLPKGIMLSPVYKRWIVKGMDALSIGRIDVKIGTLPQNLRGKDLEGNLVIMNGRNICFYTNFVNIGRNDWKLLPMGLFTDSLIQDSKIDSSGLKDFFTYTKKVQLEIPFAKGSSTFSRDYMQKLYDSLNLNQYTIRKVEMRAYSSIEGAEKVNNLLMKHRADAMVAALRKYQKSLLRSDIITAENWLEFFQDIGNTKFKSMQHLSKAEIKQQLTDPTIAAALEPILAKHRKAVLTMYLEIKSTESTFATGISILAEFQKAVAIKNVNRARSIQKELVNRIIDNKLPLEYINRLEVPQSKDFSSLLNDREVYKYLLKATTVYEAFDNFIQLRKLDVNNGRTNYNICALRFFMWQYGNDTLAQKQLLKEINILPKQGIDLTLTKRMLINYHILNCEQQMGKDNYAAKDSSLNIIRSIYKGLSFTDEDIFSLAKYYATYAHQEWSEEIIRPRIYKLNISEDLVFYYVNLLFFQPDSYGTENFKNASLNAINLNRKRFCNFFLPIGKGGASMQLLDDGQIKAVYCDACKQ